MAVELNIRVNVDGRDKVREHFRGVADAANNLADDIDGVEGSVSEFGESATDAMNDALDSFSSFGQTMQTVYHTLENLQHVLHMVEKAYEATIGAAVKFDYELREVMTLTGYSTELHKQLAKEVKALSFEYGMKKQTLVQGYYQAISSGAVDASEALGFMGTASKLAIGGATDVSTTVDGLTTVLNAFGMEADKVTHVSDQMFTAMKYGKTTIEELSRNVGTAAPHAEALGIEFDELLAMTAALTTGGLDTSYAFNQIKMLFVNLMKPTIRLGEVMADAGIHSATTAVKTEGLTATLGRISLQLNGYTREMIDSAMANGEFEGSIEKMAKEVGATDEEVQALFGSVQAGASVIALTSEAIGGKYKDIFKVMRDETVKTGEVSEEAYGIMAESAKFAIQSMVAGFSVLRTTLFEVGVMSVKDTVNFINMQLKRLIDFVDTNKVTIIRIVYSIRGVLGGLVSLLNPLLSALAGTVMQVIEAFTLWFDTLSILSPLLSILVDTTNSTGALKLIVDSLALTLELLNPILGHLIAMFITYRTLMAASTLVTSAYTMATARLVKIKTALTGAMAALNTTSVLLAAGLVALVGTYHLAHGELEKMSNGMAKAKTIFYTFISVLEIGAVEVYDANKRIGEALTGLAQLVGSTLVEITRITVGMIHSMFEGAMKLLNPITSFLPAKFGEALEKVDVTLEGTASTLDNLSTSVRKAGVANLEAATAASEDRVVRKALIKEIDRELASRHQQYDSLIQERKTIEGVTKAKKEKKDVSKEELKIIEEVSRANSLAEKVLGGQTDVIKKTKASLEGLNEEEKERVEGLEGEAKALFLTVKEEKEYQKALAKTIKKIADIYRQSDDLERGFKLIDADGELKSLEKVVDREKLALLASEMERLRVSGRLEKLI